MENYMKKILLIIFIVILSGCSIKKDEEEKEVIIEDNNVVEEKEYTDDNPIKLGLFLYDNNYHNKSKLVDTYYTNFNSGVDIGSFEVFFTDDDVIDGNKFKDTWKKYYDMYSDIDDYKVGFNIKFILKDGTNFNGNFLEPDIYKFEKYFYVYLYDDINQEDNAFYSHLEEMQDNTMITSIKIYAVDGIDEVENFILNVFTYNDDNDFDENGNYRGNSIYGIRIKRK